MKASKELVQPREDRALARLGERSVAQRRAAA